MFIPIEFQKVKEKTEKNIISIKAKYQEKCDLLASKFAGIAYYPESQPYPIDENNEPMFLLAQINLQDISSQSKLPELPDHGILQFFISNNHESYGANFENPTQQKNFAVRFWNNTQEKSKNIIIDNNEDSLVPVFGEHLLQFSTSKDSANINSIETAITLDANPFEVLEDIALDDKEEELFYNAIEKNIDNTGHKLLGNAYFINEDPRTSDEYQLLLQIDTDLDGDNDIVWANNGTAQFFIKPADLLAKNFNDVWFHWDSEED